MTEDEMVGWHHRLHGHEFEQTLGDSGGQRSLVCCSPWGRKESDMTQKLKSQFGVWSLCTWTARRPNQSILKEINPEYSLEGLMLKLKFQYFGQYSDVKCQLIGKELDVGTD